MKAKIFLFFIAFILLGCKKQEQIPTSKDWIRISDRVQMKENGEVLELKSGNFNYKIPTNRLPFKKIIFLNASLIGYVAELGAEENIVGVSSPEYIFSDKIQKLLAEGKIQNVGNEQKYNVEKIIALKPDAIFTNRIESFQNTYDLLKKNGIEVIFLDEYLEQDPLEKMDYLRVFGKLLGMDKGASTRSGEIRSAYLHLKEMAAKLKEKPTVLANEMYGNQWFMPGGRTFSARFIADAGGNYILKDNPEEKAVPMSFEEVFTKSESAKFWVNIGSHQSKSELLAVNPNYAKMKVFQSGKLYAVTAKEKGKANDYFESGVVRADLVLKDYIKIFHPEILPDYPLTYMKELK